MPLGASPLIRTVGHHLPAVPQIAQVNSRRVQLPFLRQLDVRTCLFNMRNRGYQQFRLDNGAVGRFIYREMRENGELQGIYLGFALQRENGEFTIHGRVVFSPNNIDGQNVLTGAYGLIDRLEPANITPELLNDRSTPIMVSEIIRHGYKGIGSALMSLLKGVGAQEGLAGIKILLSLSPQTDIFYSRCGFQAAGPAQWVYDLERNDEVLTSVLSRLQPREGILSQWQPKENEQVEPFRQEEHRPGLLQRLQSFFVRPRFAQAENL